MFHETTEPDCAYNVGQEGWITGLSRLCRSSSLVNENE